MAMKIKVHESLPAYYLWKARKDSICNNLKKAYDFFSNLKMQDNKDWGEAGDLALFDTDARKLIEHLKEMGYMK